jgi:hypothetical protein
LPATSVGSNVVITKRYVTALRVNPEMYRVAVEEAVVPVKVAVVAVAPTEPLNLMVTGDPAGTFVPRITTAMGSCSWLGRRRSIVLKLDPEYDGTG